MEEGNGKSIRGQRWGRPASTGRVSSLISTATSLATRGERKTKSRDGDPDLWGTQLEIQGQCQGEACGVHSKGCGTNSMAWRWDAEGGAGCSVFQGEMRCTAGHKYILGLLSLKQMGTVGSMEKTRMEQHPR